MPPAIFCCAFSMLHNSKDCSDDADAAINSRIIESNFVKHKKQILIDLGLDGSVRDKSPKGNLDEPIKELICQLNSHNDYVTTSSCSGRIALFQNSCSNNTKGGKWLLAAHHTVTMENVNSCLSPFAIKNDVMTSSSSTSVSLKHEPFLMHVQCRNIKAAKKLLQVALATGFRESGIVIGSKKIMVAIRTTSTILEVPLVVNGIMAVPSSYVTTLVKISNDKFNENYRRTAKFHQRCVVDFFTTSKSCNQWRSVITSGQRRYGHASTKVLIDNEEFIFIFGGFGEGDKGVTKLNDMLKVNLQSKTISSSCTAADDGNSTTTNRPCARMYHSMVLGKSDLLIVFGGRAGPMRAFNDVFVFNVKTFVWSAVKVTGDIIPSRWNHTAVWVNDCMYVYGGRNEKTSALGDENGGTMYILSDLHFENGFYHAQWSTTTTSNSNNPGPLISHSCNVLNNETLVIFGGQRSVSDGIIDTNVSSNVHCYDIPSRTWTQLKVKNSSPRFSHGAVVVNSRYLVVSNGITSDDNASAAALHVLDTENLEWKSVACKEEPKAIVPIRQSLHANSSSVIAIGGGIQCFGFGHSFSPAVATFPIRALGITSTTKVVKTEKSKVKAVKNLLEAQGFYDKTRKIVKQSDDDSFDIPVNESFVMTSGLKHKLSSSALKKIVLVNKQSVKSVKTLLESHNLYDKSRRIRPHSSSNQLLFAIPVTTSDVSHIASLLNDSKIISIVDDLRPSISKVPVTLNDQIKSVFQKFSATTSDIPEKFEILADVLMLDQSAFTSAEWTKDNKLQNAFQYLCHNVAKINRVARKAEINSNLKRESNVQMLYSNNSSSSTTSSWVDVRENGITYSFDITKVMFSKGNVSEKARVAAFNCSGETVVDFYAGIGYYVIPYLVHAHAAKVYALEWNPNSIEALRRNVLQNNIISKCEILPGDNRITSKTIPNVADRVNLGLLPCSKSSWENAVYVLKPTGGFIHVHANISASCHKEWKNEVVKSFQELANQKFLEVSCVHLERVKSYAPHVDHVVADLCFKKRQMT